MEPKLITQDHVEPLQNEIVSSGEGPQVERLNYGVSCKNVDFGMMNARNQLVKGVINPLLDMVLQSVKADRTLRGPDLKQRFTVNIVVTAERDLETVQ